jgi:hypothetical protein
MKCYQCGSTENTTVGGVCTVCVVDVDEAFDKIRSTGFRLTILKIDVNKKYIIARAELPDFGEPLVIITPGQVAMMNPDFTLLDGTDAGRQWYIRYFNAGECRVRWNEKERPKGINQKAGIALSSVIRQARDLRLSSTDISSSSIVVETWGAGLQAECARANPPTTPSALPQSSRLV